MGLTMENYLLEITSAQIMTLNQNLAYIKNSSSVTFLEYKHCVNKSRGMSRDHLAKNRKLLCNW